jgi:RNA polymerase sigma-70 factor (ECF subfamily)
VGSLVQTNIPTLVLRLKDGDTTAAKELVDTYQALIYAFMRRLGHDRQLSEDLTQETFLRAWFHIGQLNNCSSLNGWIYRIAINVSRLHKRRFRNGNGTSNEPPVFEEACLSADENIVQREQLERLVHIVHGLPTKLREPIILHYMQQLTISEASTALGIRQSAFKSRLNRALNLLRRELS